MLKVTSNYVEFELCVGLMRLLHESKSVLIIVTNHTFIFFFGLPPNKITAQTKSYLGESCKTYCRHVC